MGSHYSFFFQLESSTFWSQIQYTKLCTKYTVLNCKGTFTQIQQTNTLFDWLLININRNLICLHKKSLLKYWTLIRIMKKMAPGIEEIRIQWERPVTEYGRRDKFCLNVQGSPSKDANFWLRFKRWHQSPMHKNITEF